MCFGALATEQAWSQKRAQTRGLIGNLGCPSMFIQQIFLGHLGRAGDIEMNTIFTS